MEPTPAALNNLGVLSLHIGDLRRARDLFRDALRYIAGQQPTGCEQNSYEILRAEYLSLVHNGEIISESNEFVHAQGIVIADTSRACYSPCSMVSTSIVASIIMFNLGLVYHLKGLENDYVGKLELQKAQSLYLKSSTILCEAGVPCSSTGSASTDLISTALLNNLAHIKHVLLSYEDSRRYFESLIQFCLTIEPACYEDQGIATLMDQQKSKFLLNAMILLAPTIAAAA